MPCVGAHKKDGMVAKGLSGDLGVRFVERLAFKVLTFEVESVELMRERFGLKGIVCGEELDAERRRANAPACIDARA